MTEEFRNSCAELETGIKAYAKDVNSGLDKVVAAHRFTEADVTYDNLRVQRFQPLSRLRWLAADPTLSEDRRNDILTKLLIANEEIDSGAGNKYAKPSSNNTLYREMQAVANAGATNV